MKTTCALLYLVLEYQYHVATAQTTWPAATDDLEDILYLNTGYRARNFADQVTPCSHGAGPGRIAAAEWLRTAFHDMATANTYMGTGGMDGSLQYELKSGENIGTTFVSTLTTYEPFVSNRTSLADIIAAGVYTSTRSCGGPIIPIRGGRKDATAAGALGVPLPQNPIGTFKNQFLRMGYNATEMIAFTACGHTLGGVHAAFFPTNVPAGSAPNDYAVFDTTSSTFDSQIAKEFVAGSTKDPLVVSNSKQNSDTVVYASDSGNATIKSLQDPTTFANVCQTMFQRMVEVVPPGITLSSPITPYTIKPYDVQLTLLDGGTSLRFTGDIRVHTTQLSPNAVTLLLTDTTGNSYSTPVSTQYQGAAQGFDDTFSFYSFNTTLPTSTSISSFAVSLSLSSGQTQQYNNNGNGFRVDDSIIYQAPQSCIDSSGTLTVVAAARSATSPTLKVVVKNPQASPNPVSALATSSVAMALSGKMGSYGLYSASFPLNGTQAQSAVFGVYAGAASKDNILVSGLGSVCAPLGSNSTGSPTSSSSLPTSTVTSILSSAPVSSSGTAPEPVQSNSTSSLSQHSSTWWSSLGSQSGSSGTSTILTTSATSTSPSTISPSPNSSSTSSAPQSSATPSVPYTYLGCYTDTGNPRTLSSTTLSNSTMTLSTCSQFCAAHPLFGLEYADECYCGFALDGSATVQPASDCNMPCAGNSSQICGAGYRLSVYNNTAYTPPPTPTMAGFAYVGCLVDDVDARVFRGMSSASAENSYESCAVQCAAYQYMGLEYGDQCYCSATLPDPVPDTTMSECGMACAGNASETCGGAARMTVFKNEGVSTTPEIAAVQGYKYSGCYVDEVGARVLEGQSTSDSVMTVEMCEGFCDGAAWFGTEYGGECYCGEGLRNGSVVVGDQECGFVCNGNGSQYCGADARLSAWGQVILGGGAVTMSNNIYGSIARKEFKGCYSER